MPLKQNKAKAKMKASKMKAAFKKKNMDAIEESGAKNQILSASQLGLKAESLGIKKTAKTFKGRKIL